MLEDTGARVVVADRASAPKLPAVGGVELGAWTATVTTSPAGPTTTPRS